MIPQISEDIKAVRKTTDATLDEIEGISEAKAAFLSGDKSHDKSLTAAGPPVGRMGPRLPAALASGRRWPVGPKVRGQET